MFIDKSHCIGLIGVLALAACAQERVIVRERVVTQNTTNVDSDEVDVVVNTPPPPPVREVIVVRPSHAHVWIGGFWGWRGGRHVWVPGRWAMPPRPRLLWVPGHWARAGGAWRWHRGYWR